MEMQPEHGLLPEQLVRQIYDAWASHPVESAEGIPDRTGRWQIEVVVHRQATA